MSIAGGEARIRRPARRAALLTILALLPVLADWSYKEFVSPLPFWIRHYHTETLYYYSGVEMLDGELPHNLDNPGTPVQLLSAALVWVLGHDPAEFEAFRRASHALTMGLILIAAFLLVRVVFADLPDMLVVSGLWVYFICSQSLQYSYIWSPEALYFFFGALFLAAFWSACSADGSRARVFVAGMLLGVSSSVKFTFLVWIPAFLIALLVPVAGERPTHRLARAVAGACGVPVGFFAATFMVSAGYPYMFGWLARLVTRSDQYGAGQAAGLDLGTMLHHWQEAVLSAKGWHLFLLACLLMIATGCLRKRRLGERLAPGFMVLLTFSLLAIAFSYASVSRMFALRYLLPTGLCGVVLFVLAIRVWSDKMTVRAQLAIVLVTGLLLVKHVALDLRTHETQIFEGKRLNRQVREALMQVENLRPNPVTIYSFSFPQPSFALRQSAEREDFQERIDELYPLEGHYIPWSGLLRLPAGQSTWDFLIIRESDLTKFPQPVGRTLGRFGAGEYNTYVVVASPDHTR